MSGLLADKRVLVSGAAGFIGFHLARRLAGEGIEVLGLDNMSPYYDVRLKEARLAELKPLKSFSFERADLADAGGLKSRFERFRPHLVVNMAAQAGVRYSLQAPEAYVQSNLVGFANILECCRHGKVEHLVYASTSSVYGANTLMPFSEHHNTDHPVSLYAATKKANEVMAHSYSHLYGLPATGLRFFTVYGPWGRPDMALFLFTEAILADRPIEVFNQGHMARDFTYVDDVVDGVVRVMGGPPAGDPRWDGKTLDPATSRAPHRLYNIGNSSPVELLDMIAILERRLGKTAQKKMMPMQAGDVPATSADVGDLERDFGYRPSTPLAVGIGRFVDWYLAYRERR